MCYIQHQVIFLVLFLCSFQIVNSTRLNKRQLSFNTSQNFVKNVSRARLWSPYSTIAPQLLSSNASDIPATLSPNQEKSSNFFSILPELSDNDHVVKQKVNPITTTSIPVESQIAARQPPIISSIRHYKSRKSFSRTQKSGNSESTRRLHQSTEPSFLDSSRELDEDYHADQPSQSQSDKKVNVRENFIYGTPEFEVEPTRTKGTRGKLNRIISLLSPNATIDTNSNLSSSPLQLSKLPSNSSDQSPSRTRSSRKEGPAPLRKSKYKLNILGPSLSPGGIDLKSLTSFPELSPGSQNTDERQNLPISDPLRNDPRSSDNIEVQNTYDDEIPLVFIPGAVPSFGESEETLYDNKGDMTNKGKEAVSSHDDNGAENGSDPESFSDDTNESREDMDIVTKFLRMVEEKTAENCTAGQELTLGQGVVDRYGQARFQREAEIAVNRANMLTRLYKYSREVMNNEYFLHASLFSMIELDDDIFAAGHCHDERQYKNYTLFCPFAYRLPDGHIRVKDLAVEYKYASNNSEFFHVARTNAARVIKNFNQFTRGYNSYTYNESAHTEIFEEIILNVSYEDGKWSKPYYDCGGGNIWMMTYAVPFFDFQNNTYFFKGTSGIDIDLRRVDIDQCPLAPNSTELNIFAASDKCKSATTKCVPLPGLGFRRGSYRCHCKDGFYFPNVSSSDKYFHGFLLEEEYEKKFLGRVTRYDESGAFECLLCPYGCDSCVDDKPCVVSLNWLMRSAILILQIVIILMLPIVGLFTWKYAEIKVIRAASPVLLGFIVLGAFFIYCTILVLYPNPSIITCTLRVWLREVGFSLAYGALMLKTWRISVIFRVRSAKAVKITDLDLMKRLGIIVGMFSALLVIRTLVAPPVSIVHFTADNLKAWLCISDWWDHSFTIMELSFLVWGIRLCIVVRKAPSEFNESKFISLAIYNEFLLSLFLNISMLFLQSPANPDLLYIIFFCHVQLTMTFLLCLIFGSKAYMVFRGHGKGSSSDESRNTAAKFISKGRSGAQGTKASLSAQNSTGTGLHASLVSNALLHDSSPGARLPEDIQAEFQRFYSQLEELKERNVKLGNRQLVDKIMAMQAAAVTLLSTVSDTDTNGFHCPTSITKPTSIPSPKEIKGNKTTGTPGKPNSLLRHISEEESSTAHPKHSSLDKSQALNGNSGQAQASSSNSFDLPRKTFGEDDSEKLSTVCDVEIESICSKVPAETEKPEKMEPISTDEDDELEYMDVDDYEEEDEVGNSIRNTLLTPLGQNIQSESYTAKGSESEKEKTIPGSVITSNAPTKAPLSQELGLSPVEKVEALEPLPQSGGMVGNQSQEMVSSQPSSTATGKSRTGGKIILDLDDKSRFTEEITV